MTVQEVDYVELPATGEQSRPAFEREKIESSTFTTTAWFLSNFGKIAHHVWWGYKVGYYLVAFPCLFALSFIVDLVIIAVCFGADLVKRLLALVLSSMQTAAKILLAAAAVILVAMYIYNNGVDGMLSDYKDMCEWLKRCFVSSQ